MDRDLPHHTNTLFAILVVVVWFTRQNVRRERREKKKGLMNCLILLK
jgi:hypothetical protein